MRRGRTAGFSRHPAQVKVFALSIPTFTSARDLVLAESCVLELLTR